MIGRMFLDRKLPLDRHILLVSGRASFEIMQKALMAGVPIVCAVSPRHSQSLTANGARFVTTKRAPLFETSSQGRSIVASSARRRRAPRPAAAR